jgi:hypothetical protein
MEIGKADESLRAADYCYKEGRYNSCVSRAYYSMYQAAQVGLEAAGFVRGRVEPFRIAGNFCKRAYSST